MAVRYGPVSDLAAESRDTEGKVVYADQLVAVRRTIAPVGLTVAGDIDISNSSSVAQLLRKGFRAGDTPHVDLSRVSFCDVSGIRALVSLAMELGPRRCLLLHGLPPQLETVLRVTGWADLPGLELCDCGKST